MNSIATNKTLPDSAYSAQQHCARHAPTLTAEQMQ